METVFLGGTCNDSSWRQDIIALFEEEKISYFNPVLKDNDEWTDAKRKIEDEAKIRCEYCLITITPEMTGYYSVAEAVDMSNKDPKRIIFCAIRNVDDIGFSESQWESVIAIGEMITSNGGYFCDNLNDVVAYIKQNARSEKSLLVKTRSGRYLFILPF